MENVSGHVIDRNGSGHGLCGYVMVTSLLCVPRLTGEPAGGYTLSSQHGCLQPNLLKLKEKDENNFDNMKFIFDILKINFIN